jgi:hypothetical protein
VEASVARDGIVLRQKVHIAKPVSLARQLDQSDAAVRAAGPRTIQVGRRGNEGRESPCGPCSPNRSPLTRSGGFPAGPLTEPSGEGAAGRRDARAAHGQRPPRRRRVSGTGRRADRGPADGCSPRTTLSGAAVQRCGFRAKERMASSTWLNHFDGGKRRALLDPVVGGVDIVSR